LIKIPKDKFGRRLRRNRKGQFVIFLGVSMVIVMVAFSSLIASAQIFRVSMQQTDFRKAATEVAVNFRAALAVSLAQVSKTLDNEASVCMYANYTDLNDYPSAQNSGREFMSSWHRSIQSNYPGLGLNLSLTSPSYQCSWEDSAGYSLATSRFTLDILTYGFYGYGGSTSAGLNLTILGMNPAKTDGRTVAFYFEVQKEDGSPISDLFKSSILMFFQQAGSGAFTLSSAKNLTYLGDGNYQGSLLMYQTTIIQNLAQTKDYILHTMKSTDFLTQYQSTGQTQLSGLIDQTVAAYNAGELSQAYDILVDVIRPKLVPKGSGTWVTDTADTSDVLGWIDLIKNQLLPTIRLSIQDSRGIVVGAVQTLSTVVVDNSRPVTQSVMATPTPTNGATSVTLSAVISDLGTGYSDIVSAEYFVDTFGANGSGLSMSGTDGSFDTPWEAVTATVPVSGLTLGVHMLYVHGKDAAGYWSKLVSTAINVTNTKVMYVQDITMHGFRSGSYHWADAYVTIFDAAGKPVVGATVTGHWSGAVSGTYSYNTDSNGRVIFTSSRKYGSSTYTFTFTVDNVAKSGYIYRSSMNKMTSKSIIV
jgi:hypothetical protein